MNKEFKLDLGIILLVVSGYLCSVHRGFLLGIPMAFIGGIILSNLNEENEQH